MSTAGVPVYADRGRHGGYSLLPGFRTELTGLNHEEALALLTAGSSRGGRVFGLSAPLASAMRKVVDALPEGHRGNLDDAVKRFLVEPETDLLSRRQSAEDVSKEVMGQVRRAVLTGHRLRFHYRAPDREPRWHAVDPIGLVTVRDRTYLLAYKSGEDRTYRLSRMLEAHELPEPAERPADVDLERTWAERTARFLSENHLPVTVRVKASRRTELLDSARAVRAEVPDVADWVRLDLMFEDLRHAVWAVWQVGTDAEVVAPDSLRDALRDRVREMSVLYGVSFVHRDGARRGSSTGSVAPLGAGRSRS